MPESKRRVQYEAEAEKALAESMGDTLAEMSWPGVFSGGKQILATQTTKRGDFDVMSFKFSDGSEMNIVGKFEVRYKQPLKLNEVIQDEQLSLEEGES